MVSSVFSSTSVETDTHFIHSLHDKGQALNRLSLGVHRMNEKPNQWTDSQLRTELQGPACYRNQLIHDFPVSVALVTSISEGCLSMPGIHQHTKEMAELEHKQKVL